MNHPWVRSVDQCLRNKSIAGCGDCVLCLKVAAAADGSTTAVLDGNCEDLNDGVSVVAFRRSEIRCRPYHVSKEFDMNNNEDRSPFAQQVAPQKKTCVPLVVRETKRRHCRLIKQKSW